MNKALIAIISIITMGLLGPRHHQAMQYKSVRFVDENHYRVDWSLHVKNGSSELTYDSDSTGTIRIPANFNNNLSAKVIFKHLQGVAKTCIIPTVLMSKELTVGILLSNSVYTFKNGFTNLQEVAH
jgi:hypothetical protein